MSRLPRCDVPRAANDAEALRQINEALAQRDFRRDWSHPGTHIWRGRFQITGKAYPISLEINDLDFAQLPKIKVDDAQSLPARAIPHL